MTQFRIPGCTCFIAGDDFEFGTLARHRSWSPRALERFALGQPAVVPDPSAPPVSSAATAAVTQAETIDPDIEALDLAPTARSGAYALKKAHPTVSFTSGRRDKADQAHAMAGNVVSNRKWIEQTYTKSAASKRCQQWVDDNLQATSKGEIAAGLLSVMNALSDSQLALFSKHLAGQAFDVQPVEADAEAIKATIRSLPGLGKFLDREGGLVRWHAQF